MVDLGLSKSLSTLVSSKFTAAEKSGQLIFSSTDVAVVRSSRWVPLLPRYCPALAKKPVSKDTKDEKKPKPDPFDNPPQDLLITSVPTASPTHHLVLNKYPIIKNHFILSTIPWKSQTALLEPEDLAISHALLRTWPAPGTQRSLFAFFNSGSDSGASQPHRHVQFLPVEAMATPESESAGWRPAIEAMSDECQDTEEYTVQACSAFPFAHFACKLPPHPDPKTLHESYLSLYAAAVEAVSQSSADKYSATGNASTTVNDNISYNLAMTTKVMAICPRKSETAPLSDGEGEVGFNGTILAGTCMLKDEEVWKKILDQPERMEGVLEGIGFPFPAEASGIRAET